MAPTLYPLRSKGQVMTVVFTRIAFFCAVLLAAVAGAPALAADAPPWTEADRAEMQSIVDTLLTPMMGHANQAVSLAQSDPTKACDEAKQAAAQAGEIDQRISEFTARLTSEGKDTARLEPLNGKIQELKTEAPKLQNAVCNGDLQGSTDPTARAIEDKINGYVRRYANDVTAANAAQSAGDPVTACASEKDGLDALLGLETYINELSSLPGLGAADKAKFQEMNGKVHHWQDQLRGASEHCPAA